MCGSPQLLSDQIWASLDGERPGGSSTLGFHPSDLRGQAPGAAGRGSRGCHGSPERSLAAAVNYYDLPAYAALLPPAAAEPCGATLAPFSHWAAHDPPAQRCESYMSPLPPSPVDTAIVPCLIVKPSNISWLSPYPHVGAGGLGSLSSSELLRLLSDPRVHPGWPLQLPSSPCVQSSNFETL